MPPNPNQKVPALSTDCKEELHRALFPVEGDDMVLIDRTLM